MDANKEWAGVEEMRKVAKRAKKLARFRYRVKELKDIVGKE